MSSTFWLVGLGIVELALSISVIDGCQSHCDRIEGCRSSVCNTTAVSPHCTGIFSTADGSRFCYSEDSFCYPNHVLCPGSTEHSSSSPYDKMASEDGCPTPLDYVEVFWWSEWPSLPKLTHTEFVEYYRRLLLLLKSNCAYMRVTKLILRVLDPEYPLAMPISIWYPNNDVTQSALFTELLVKLNETSVKEIEMLPYVGGDGNLDAWKKWSPDGESVMAGTYAFAAEYNKYLPDGIKFTGITVDIEEIHHLPEYDMITNASAEYDFKGGHTDLGFGMAFPHTNIGLIQSCPFMSSFYLEMYDMAFKTSPFLKYKDEADELIDFLSTNALDDNRRKVYNDYSDRVHLMWSIQSNGLPCMYPIYHGRCGMGNTDFGHWSCRSFNEFLSKVRSGLDTPDVHHGIYQVDFWPSSMAPPSLKGCYSANCK